MLRSLLFVPGDSERKLTAARDVAASALIMDLEDAVAQPRKSIARATVAEYLRERRADSRHELWVRINGLDTAECERDLEAIVPARPAGIVLPKCTPDQLRELASKVDDLEAAAGHTSGDIGLIPIVTETPAAVFQLGGYTPNMPRLRGLTWGAEDLSVVIGANASRDAAGELLPVFQHVQSLVVLAAGAAAVQAIDTVYHRVDDTEGLNKAIYRSRRQGFTAMLAIHPGQVPVINAAFQPTAEEIEQARRVVQAFAEAGGTGTIRLDGKMHDQPHLAAAQRVLSRGQL